MHLFYQPEFTSGEHTLNDEEFHHCVKVLRHVEGDLIHITDGKGSRCSAAIIQINKNALEFSVKEVALTPPPSFEVNLFIAPTKQQERMEWMVEKLCEIGITSITFIQTTNSERSKLRIDRLEKKALSALKQSKGNWITRLNAMVDFDKSLSATQSPIKLIAAVTDNSPFYGSIIRPGISTDIFIGPEGDFTQKEIVLAQNKGAKTVSLGPKILRTETAGLLSSYFVMTVNQTSA